MSERKKTLFVVGTPIGNLEDITLRAIRVLGQVGLVAAEDTRVTRKLFDRHGISTPLTSYHEHNKKIKIPQLIDALSQKDVALVSDAGMPGVNDPGAELVRAAYEGGFVVESIPGPSALTAAISVSGLPVEQFVYLGFLPRKKLERVRLLKSLEFEKRALVAFETPHRMLSTLQDINQHIGERSISICRELTKLHEEIFRGNASRALEYFDHPKGEFTLVIEGSSADGPAVVLDHTDVSSLISQLKTNGVKAKSGVPKIMEMTGLPRREVYSRWLEVEEIEVRRIEP